MGSRLAFILIIIPLFITQKVYAQTQNDFRNVKWGMSESQVKKLEKIKLDKNKNHLSGMAKVGGYDALLQYTFGSGKLTGATYLYIIEHYIPNQYLDDYNKIKDILISKYGRPSVDTTEWKSEASQAAFKDDGLAISFGQLELRCIWHVGKTSIIHTIRGRDSKVLIGTSYFSEEFMKYNYMDKTDNKDF